MVDPIEFHNKLVNNTETLPKRSALIKTCLAFDITLDEGKQLKSRYRKIKYLKTLITT